MRPLLHAAILAGAGLFLAFPASAQTAEDLKRLLDQGKVEEAYQLGRRAPQQLGTPAFDLHYGIAAVHSGRAAEGVLALERFLLAFPEHEGAQLELARGYFLIGEDARAKEEFEAIAARKPPPEVARIIAEHLDALRYRESRYRPTARAWLDAGGGYDSNPRAGVDNPTLSLPILGEVTVPDTGLAVSDRTWTYGGGFRVTGPINANTIAFAAAQADATRYQDVKEFNQDVYAGTAGFQGKQGPFGWRVGMSTGYQTLARQPYRRTNGAFVDGSYVLGERDAISAGLQAGKFAYFGTNVVRDSDFAAAQVGWRHRFASPWRPEIELGGNVGREENLSDDRQDLSRDLYGTRLAFALTPWAAWTFSGSVQHQRSDYKAADVVLQTTREDKYNVGELGVAWALLPALAIRAEFSVAKNESNIALYDYRRKTGLVRLRYEFR